MARVPLLRDELAHKTLVARAPPDRQPSADLLLDPAHLLVQGAAREPVGGARGDGVHGRELEEADRLVDVVVLHDGRERELDRKSTRLNSSHSGESRMPSSA